jgi:hypothetical protein
MRPEITGKKIGDLIPLDQRFGCTVKFAAQYAGISKSSVYEMLASGDLAGREIAGRKIVEVQGPRGLLQLCGKAPSAKRETARSDSSGLAVIDSGPVSCRAAKRGSPRKERV